MNTWQPIKEYNYKKHPRAVFFHPKTKNESGRHFLPESVTFDTYSRHRPCTHFLVLPEYPEVPIE
jgi:hypothetical protein